MSPRCAETNQGVPRVFDGYIGDVSISEDYGSGSDGSGDRRCRSVGGLCSSIRNMNFCDDV